MLVLQIIVTKFFVCGEKEKIRQRVIRFCDRFQVFWF